MFDHVMYIHSCRVGFRIHRAQSYAFLLRICSVWLTPREVCIGFQPPNLFSMGSSPAWMLSVLTGSNSLPQVHVGLWLAAEHWECIEVVSPHIPPIQFIKWLKQTNFLLSFEKVEQEEPIHPPNPTTCLSFFYLPWQKINYICLIIPSSLGGPILRPC